MSRIAYTILSCVLLSAITGREAFGQQQTYALSGTLVTPNGIVDDGLVLVSDGAIRGVGAGMVVPAGTPVVKTDGVIFPGLIDLHNHLIWNVFPRWKPPSLVGDRYEWQALPDYGAKLSGPESILVSRGDGCDMERYAEVKAMIGGATSVVGSFSPSEADPRRNACDRGLARNLDYASGLYSRDLNHEPLDYEVFPLEIPAARAEAIRQSMSSGETKALLIHLSEGKDASAAREFKMIKARDFLRPGLSIIHGVALDESDFHEMAAKGVGLIWSPHSNLELYGVTTQVGLAKAAGLVIALAPDWSPSGSNSMLEELQYAEMWNSKQVSPILTNYDLFQMSTENPARLAGVSDKIGSLAVGYAADIVVLPRIPGSPLLALTHGAPGSVKLVLVGGKAMLGDPVLMHQLLPGRKLESLQVCGHTEDLNIANETNGESWKDIQLQLSSELARVNLHLADLADCHHYVH